MTRIAALIMLFAATATARAQTYVRPSKGTPITVFTRPTFTAGQAEPTSPVYDWTAFESLSVVMVAGNKCATSVWLEGATTPAGPFTSSSVNDPNNQVTVYSVSAAPVVSVTKFYTVSNLPPYIRFRLGNNANPAPNLPNTCDGSGGPNGPANYFTSLQVTPLPFAVRKEVSGSVTSASPFPTNVAPVIVGGSTSTTSPQVYRLGLDGNGYMPTGYYTYNTRSRVNITNVRTIALAAALDQASVVVQNVGTVPVLCLYGLSNTVSTANYSFAISAGTAPNDGLGGRVTIPGLYDGMECITAAGNADIVITRFW